MKKINKSSGATSSIILILGVILIILVIVIFVVLRISAVKKANDTKAKEVNISTEAPKPLYDTQLGDVKFIFESAQDVGNTLQSKNINYRSNLVTTEKFVKVIVGAQNKGKLNVKKGTWGIGNIIDSEGRNFVPVTQDSGSYYFLDPSSLCGALLKPEFEPTSCEQYYEVSKESKGLKVEVNIKNENSLKVKQEAFLDLIVP